MHLPVMSHDLALGIHQQSRVETLHAVGAEPHRATAENHPRLITAEIRKNSGRITKILQRLLQAGMSIRNLPVIIETLCDESQQDRDIARLVDAVRQRLQDLKHQHAPVSHG